MWVAFNDTCHNPILNDVADKTLKNKTSSATASVGLTQQQLHCPVQTDLLSFDNDHDQLEVYADSAELVCWTDI